MWLQKVGLAYHSPHKFRRGHAVYAIKNAKDIPALKAVSQNLMHANLSITDGIYGILSDLDVRKEISTLGQKVMPRDGENMGDLIFMTRQFLAGLEASQQK